jgi:hypothetical protein
VSTYTDDQAETAKAVSDFVNRHGSAAMRNVAEIMANDHPTLQQGVMRLFVQYVNVMATKEYTDARNEASVNLAKKLVDEWGDGPYLPLI